MSTDHTVSFASTRVHTLESDTPSRAYTVSVALPLSYQSAPGRRYPTIYLLDANFHFGMVTDITRQMTLDGDFPETLVVGIGYPLKGWLQSAFNRAILRRSRDLTPDTDPSVAKLICKWINVKRVSMGGAESFLAFLKDRAIPFVEGRYRCRPSARVLVGHSFGGLFALYTLFHDYRLFKGYLAASPTLYYSDRLVFRYEAEFARRHRTLPVKLFLAVGDREEDPEFQMTSNFVHFAGKVAARHYGGLSMSTLVISNSGHSASTATAYQAGLHSMLGRKAT